MARFNLTKHPEDPELRTLYQEMLEGGMQGSEEGVPFNAITAMADQPALVEIKKVFERSTGFWTAAKTLDHTIPVTKFTLCFFTISTACWRPMSGLP